MKKRIILAVALTILNTILCLAQDREKKFSFYGTTDPVATYHDGFNFGVGVEYQMNYFYTGAQLYTFPELRGKTYTHLIGSVGLNLHANNSIWRFFSGIHAGVIYREGGHAIFGFEGGIDFKIKGTSLYFGIGGSYDYRADGKVWGANEPNYWRLNGNGRFGFLW